jgi:putative inorganic carbon (HCO3(-)) transporter
VSTALNKFNDKVVPALSLDAADGRWSSTLSGSALLRLWFGLRRACRGSWERSAAAGSFLQLGSFVAVLLLFFILAAPKFANDKEWLALLVVAAFGMRLVGTLLNGAETYRPSAIDGLVLLYLACNVVSSFASHYLRESLLGLAKWFVYIIAYFLFTASLQQSARRRSTLTLASLIAGGLLVSLYGLYQYKMGVAPLATWEDPTIEDKATRVFSTLGNPNLLAGYLIPLVPLSLALSAMPLFSRGVIRWLSLPVFAATGIITLATVLTGSRGAYIALIFEAAIIAMVSGSWLWRQPKARLPLLAAIVLVPLCVVAVVHFALPSFEYRFLSIFAGSEHSSNAYRMNVWRSSLEMFKDNWWLGIGTGNKTFRLAYGLYMRSGFDALGTYCVPLEVAVETGIPGLLVFAWLLVAVVSRAHNRFWETADPMIRCLAAGAAAAIVGMMAHGLVDTVFYRPQVQFIFWLAVSLIVALPAARSISGADTSAD